MAGNVVEYFNPAPCLDGIPASGNATGFYYLLAYCGRANCIVRGFGHESNEIFARAWLTGRYPPEQRSQVPGGICRWDIVVDVRVFHDAVDAFHPNAEHIDWELREQSAKFENGRSLYKSHLFESGRSIAKPVRLNVGGAFPQWFHRLEYFLLAVA